MYKHDKLCNKIRAFNRFYTVHAGFLNSTYLGSNYSTTELHSLKVIESGNVIDVFTQLSVDYI